MYIKIEAFKQLFNLEPQDEWALLEPTLEQKLKDLYDRNNKE